MLEVGESLAVALTASHTQGEQKKNGEKRRVDKTKQTDDKIGDRRCRHRERELRNKHTHTHTLMHTRTHTKNVKKTGPTLRFLRVYIFSNNFSFFVFR